MKRFFIALILIVYTAIMIFSPVNAAALIDEQKRIFSKGIYYYNVDACSQQKLEADPKISGPVYVMGDSIIEGAKTELELAFGRENLEVTKIDGVGSRSFVSKGTGETNGLEAIEAGKSDIESANSVVIALGTNGEGSAGQFENRAKKAIEKIKEANSSAKIYWVKIFSTADKISHKKSYNKVIDSLGVSVIDPNGQNIALSDGVHPKPEGYKKYAKLIAEQVKSGSASITMSDIKKLENPLEGSSTGGNIDPKAIVLHWWGSNPKKGISPLANTLRGRGLSVQFGVTHDGEIWQLTKNETTLSSHATGGNSTSFGIEIEGGPSDFGPNGKKNNPKKFQAVSKLVAYLGNKYGIDLNKRDATCGAPKGLLSHKDLNNCPRAETKSDVDEDYFQDVKNEAKNLIGNGGQGGPTDAPSPNKSQPKESIDLSKIAKENNLHSAAVMQLGQKELLADYKSETSPSAVASLIKLVIADAFLSKNPRLDKKITIKSSQLYSSSAQGTAWDPKAGEEFTLKQSLEYTLKNSSNTHANVLIDELGGPAAATAQAEELGYKSTKITSYFSSTGGGTPRKSNAQDLTKAMDNIFSEEQGDYKTAQAALEKSTYTFGLESAANKWGGSSQVTGNVAIFNQGDKKYIISTIVSGEWQDTLSDVPSTAGTKPSPSVEKVKSATKEVLLELSTSNEQGEIPKGCSCSEGGDAEELEGENDSVKLYNFLISEVGGFAMNSVQAAGVVGNAMNETGGNNYNLDPTVIGVGMCDPNCYGIVQWSVGRTAAMRAWAASKGKDPTKLVTQAEYIKVELKGPESAAWNELKKVSGSDEAAARKAAKTFDDLYERSSAGDQERQDNAARFFKEYVKGGGLTGGTPDSSGSCASSEPGSGTSSGRFDWPDDGRKDILTSCFGARSSPGGIGSTNHQGVDIGSAADKSVVAADGGKVTLAGSGVNNIIEIDHGNGYKTRYLHNETVTVQNDKKVSKGQKIGTVGTRGQSTGYHIHFEVYKNGSVIDPLNELPKDGRTMIGSNCNGRTF